MPTFAAVFEELKQNSMMRTLTWIACGLVVMLTASCSDKKEGRDVRPVSVKTMTVVTSSTAETQGYSGTIEEASGSALSFSAVGTLKSVNVCEGQMVRQGQLIATIDETTLRSAYETALAAKEQALDAEQRMRLLHDAGSLPEIKWIEVQTQVRQALAAEKMAHKALSDARLFAPFSGYVSQKQAEAGQSVAPGVPIVKLGKIDQVKVKISVPESEIANIRNGQVMRVTLAALGGKQFEARVTEKGVSADVLTRLYDVKGTISNPHHELLPGMIADVCVDGVQPTVQNDTVIALPAEIIQIDADNQTFVWTVVDGKAKKTYIETGRNIGELIAISSGLRQGDVVICEGQQKVSNGTKVKSEE